MKEDSNLWDRLNLCRHQRYLSDRFIASIYFSHIVPLILELDTVHDQVGPTQDEPLVLPDHFLPCTDDPVFLLLDQSAAPYDLNMKDLFNN